MVLWLHVGDRIVKQKLPRQIVESWRVAARIGRNLQVFAVRCTAFTSDATSKMRSEPPLLCPICIAERSFRPCAGGTWSATRQSHREPDD